MISQGLTLCKKYEQMAVAGGFEMIFELYGIG
jgi:hypothetical protein